MIPMTPLIPGGQGLEEMLLLLLLQNPDLGQQTSRIQQIVGGVDPGGPTNPGIGPGGGPNLGPGDHPGSNDLLRQLMLIQMQQQQRARMASLGGNNPGAGGGRIAKPGGGL